MPPKRVGGNLQKKTLEALKQSVADGELPMINALLRRLDQMGQSQLDEVKAAKTARDELSHGGAADGGVGGGVGGHEVPCVFAPQMGFRFRFRSNTPAFLKKTHRR